MSKALRIAGGVAALWDDASDDDPFTTPLSNLSRVKFHSDLDYIKVIDEQTVSVNFPSRNAGLHTQSYTLFAHGLGIQPLVFATCTLSGVEVAFTGSVPVQVGAGFIGGLARWVTIGADATNVYAYEYTRVSTGDNIPALNSFSITVWVTDEDLT